MLPISKKAQLISGDKKTFKKKTSLFQEIKSIFRAMFFYACFSRCPHNFFQIGPFFYILPFLAICPLFFYIWLPSLTFPKIDLMFFLLNVFLLL